ncbi:hypothetical protein, unlikely [Trypanosoma brucei brucei TREU927]|uniref:Uncharacterized protein n=1 Tax=Trypanosoma brucei brucei (strain 927/4 GUTat10.1) TaxID=185431 RepID=Q38E00_TRYB2|nr:hypothetical protein, unlikely [Trypanosoma brucei brucei TREU927]EAN76970.1 hypothetical protein, unlikely [Trypanosoma brucei brucei TREU927]
MGAEMHSCSVKRFSVARLRTSAPAHTHTHTHTHRTELMTRLITQKALTQHGRRQKVYWARFGAANPSILIQSFQTMSLANAGMSWGRMNGIRKPHEVCGAFSRLPRQRYRLLWWLR